MSEGFAAIPNWMFRDESVSLYALMVYGALASHTGPGGIHPARETIAREARCSVRQVARALVELEDLGVVVRVRRKSAIGRAPSGYELRPSGRLGTDEQYEEVEDSQSLTLGVEDYSDRGSGLGVLDVPLIEEEPIKNASEYFDEFWSIYPRHVAKAAARAKFEVLAKRRVDLAEVVEGARRYVASGDLPEPRFIPHPTTWLNQGRWEDETVAAASGPSSADGRPSQEDWLSARGITLAQYQEHYREPGWLEELERAYLRRLDE